MLNKNARAIAMAMLLLVTSCSDNGQFVLPPGSERAGRDAFIALNCHQCHSVIGYRHGDPLNIAQSTEDGVADGGVRLGGPSHIVRTYSDLIESLVDPSHRISHAPAAIEMPVYNEVMTVQQLIDLTAYLQARYSLWSPRYVYYHYF